MEDSTFDELTRKDSFAVAQVTLYLLMIQQVLATLMILVGAIPVGGDHIRVSQRISLIAVSVVQTLCFGIGYLLLARCLNRCTKPIWRIAMGVFILHVGVAVVLNFSQGGLDQLLRGSLAIAAAVSLWNGRHAIRYEIRTIRSDSARSRRLENSHHPTPKPKLEVE